MTDAPVLVTGGSGFVAGHCILALLDAGHRVRTTVRSLSREPDVREVLSQAGMTRPDALSFVEADLTRDDGWGEAVAGCDHVLHVASPVHTQAVKDEDDVIRPAREGTLRVLRAARDGGVRRVVLTSALHAVGFGHPPRPGRVFTEDDWSVLDGPGVDAYGRSKILAEQAAWSFVDTEGGGLELTVLLPVAVMGPVMGPQVSGANHIVQASLKGDIPAYPHMYIPVVDVRDVAAAHVAAMTADGAAGERILVTTGAPAMAMQRIGGVLRDRLGERAAKVPTRTLPDLLVRVAARFRADLRPVAADLHVVKQVSDAKMRSVLGVAPRPAEEAVAAAGESMIARSLV